MLETILFFIFIVLSALYVLWIITILIPRKESWAAYTPAVSIILPAHNEEKYLGRTIQSLLVDGYPKKEIIVVDDGSTDRTAEIAKSFGKVKVIRGNHEGKSAALNRGLKKARYDIVVTLDADSEVSRGTIANLVRPLRSSKIGGVTGTIRARVTKNPMTWFQDFEYIMSSGWRYTCSGVNGNSILPGFAAFRKSAINKIGGFSKDTLTEDFDIAVSLRRAGYLTETVRGASITTNVPHTIPSFIRQRLRWGRGTLQVVRKHFNFIFSRESGSLGYFSVPTQFYWYVHAFVYTPIIIYLMLIVWSKTAVASAGYLSFQFVQHLFTMFSIYGIFDLLFKVVTQQYALTGPIFFSLLMFFLSLTYVLIVFTKISRPNISIIFVYVFFFPFSLFNMLVLAASAVQTAIYPDRKNKWS